MTAITVDGGEMMVYQVLSTGTSANTASITIGGSGASTTGDWYSWNEWAVIQPPNTLLPYPAPIPYFVPPTNPEPSLHHCAHCRTASPDTDRRGNCIACGAPLEDER